MFQTAGVGVTAEITEMALFDQKNELGLLSIQLLSKDG
jgi:hypothetical protein